MKRIHAATVAVAVSLLLLWLLQPEKELSQTVLPIRTGSEDSLLCVRSNADSARIGVYSPDDGRTSWHNAATLHAVLKADCRYYLILQSDAPFSPTWTLYPIKSG